MLLSWALARELDPDQPASAVAAGIAGFLIFLTGPTNLGAVTALLFAVRLVARSPGLPPTKVDLIWLPALAAYTARSMGGFLAGVALRPRWHGTRSRPLAHDRHSAPLLRRCWP